MRVLIVEDSTNLAGQLRVALAEAQFAVDLASDGTEALFLGETEPYDAVVLDLGLPGMDGVTVLRKWRAIGRKMPVLILTARSSWSEKVAGLNAGADDYLTKPFVMQELVARVHALIRRTHGHVRSEFSLGRLVVDTAASQALIDGMPLRLTGLEYRVLAYLALHAGEVVSKTQMTEHLYDQDFDRDSNTLEVIIGRLRKKLGDGFIMTLRGQGYRLIPNDG
jgi:two-component system OmpR family response regulator